MRQEAEQLTGGMEVPRFRVTQAPARLPRRFLPSRRCAWWGPPPWAASGSWGAPSSSTPNLRLCLSTKSVVNQRFLILQVGHDHFIRPYLSTSRALTWSIGNCKDKERNKERIRLPKRRNKKETKKELDCRREGTRFKKGFTGTFALQILHFLYLNVC